MSSEIDADLLGKLAGQVVNVFRSWVARCEDLPVAVAAILALTEVVKQSQASTIMGLEVELKAASDILKETNPNSISLKAGCELFNRYVMRTLSDLPDFQHCKNHLISRGEHFSSMSLKSRQKISEFGDQFIQDNSVILVHGRSRVVLGILAQAVKKGKIFSVIVTEGRPCEDGEFVSKELNKLGIPVSSVLDAAVAAKIHQVDFILFGAEAVVESGGVINSIGTYQISIVAKSLNKPVYVAVESYKFARLFPLTQTDIPQVIQRKDSEIPCDYTPPKYITLLFTDLGILTPSAVSDELIKLYY